MKKKGRILISLLGICSSLLLGRNEEPTSPNSASPRENYSFRRSSICTPRKSSPMTSPNRQITGKSVACSKELLLNTRTLRERFFTRIRVGNIRWQTTKPRSGREALSNRCRERETASIFRRWKTSLPS